MSSNGSPNGRSRVSLPPTTPLIEKGCDVWILHQFINAISDVFTPYHAFTQKFTYYYFINIITFYHSSFSFSVLIVLLTTPYISLLTKEAGIMRGDYICQSPIHGPTRLADLNRVPGRETIYWDSLPDFFFFFKAELYLWVWPTSYNIIKILYPYQRLPPEWCPSKSRHL